MAPSIEVRDVRDLCCPYCGSYQVDWVRCCFREFLDRDTAVFDADLSCGDCEEAWDASLEFSVSVMKVDLGDTALEEVIG